MLSFNTRSDCRRYLLPLHERLEFLRALYIAEPLGGYSRIAVGVCCLLDTRVEVAGDFVFRIDVLQSILEDIIICFGCSCKQVKRINLPLRRCSIVSLGCGVILQCLCIADALLLLLARRLVYLLRSQLLAL